MTEVHRAICALDCPDCCSLLVTVEDGRATRLRGDPDHPITRGFLCAKVTQYLEREYHPDRLLHPMRRTGPKGEGRFERISWDEALDTVAARLSSIAAGHGPEAILPYSYGGTLGYLNGQGMDRRFFHRLGASRLGRTICSSAGAAGLADSLGLRYGFEMEQLRHSKLILVWGANIHGAGVHCWPFIVEARRQGARMYTIDPVRNRTGEAADRHFYINPGSDPALALGMMHVILAEGLEDKDYIARHTLGIEDLREKVRQYPPERTAALTGISAGEIVNLAREYATLRPAAIRTNYGVQRSERGALAVRTIALLPALVGAWKEPGGGVLLSTSGAFHVNTDALQRPDLQMLSPLGRVAREVNMSRLAEALTELDGPPVKALVVYNSNPAAIAPDRVRVLKGMAREDLFTVVLEQFQTDSADYADIVLPATTFLEHTDIYFSYGHYYLQMARPVLPPAGEAKSNVEVFRLLAGRMGFQDPCFRDSEDDMIRSLLASGHPFFAGLTLEELDRRRTVRLRISPEGTPFLPFAGGGFGTPSGKCEFHAETLDYEPPVESRHGSAGLRARYPLEFISAKCDTGLNSTFGHRAEVDAETATLHLCAADADARGIVSGDKVRVFNGRGSLVVMASVDGKVSPGVVCLPSVRWGKRAADSANPNNLTSTRLTDKGAGATFYSCLVQVEKCTD